jgi:DNA-binding transcriptional LysR family regulator
MKLSDIDLNLLIVFNQLLLDRNVSTSAEKLNLTQPAVSNALKRLRHILNDELFIRTSKGMSPTPYAMTLAEPIGYALDSLHNALNQEPTFDPSTSQRTFTLAITDIGEIYFVPTLIAELSRQAPHVKISTVRNNANNLSEEMESGTVDIAIGLIPSLKTGFFQRRLFNQKYVCIFRNNHPSATNPISLESYQSLGHVSVTSANTGHNQIDQLIEGKGIQRDVRLYVPHFVAVGHILQTTDLIATVPERFAQKSEGPFGLTTSPPPVDLPEISINLLWHAKYNRDPANMWLRQLIVKLFLDR